MNNENQDLEYHGHGALMLFLGLLVGSLTGALAMLLMAPQSGEKTRSQIQAKGIELRDQASDMLEDTIGQARLEGNKISTLGRQKANEYLHNGQVMLAGQLEHISETVQNGAKAIQVS